MFKQVRFTMVLALLLGGVLAACGSAPAPIPFSQIPVFTGAKESTNDVLVATLGAAVDAAKGQNTTKSAEGKAYEAPEGTTFDAIVAFYKGALEKDGWAVQSSTAPALSLTRGKQGIVVTHVEAVGGIVVMLFETN